MNEALRLAEALIACRSVTPADDGCCELLAAQLLPAGFVCERLDAGPAGGIVSNLWAVHDSGRPGPTLLLAGHTDVVPSGPAAQWASEPFVPSHREGRLYGRGAVDMKTAVAAMTVAAARFVRERPQHGGRVALLFTSDEEGPSLHGTLHAVQVLKARGERLDLCIVGEPTSVERVGDMVKNGRRGSLSARLTVKGVQGHIAYPQLARNPIHGFAPALAELAATRWDEGNAYFPPTSWQVSNLHAGTGAGNMIPGELVADFNFRFSTESTPAALQARVLEVLNRHGLEFEIAWTLGGEPFLTPPGTLHAALAAAIQAEFGIEPVLSTTGGTSDGRFIARICPQVMEFGVLNASAHKIDEWVEVASIAPLANVYRRTLEALLP
ncbi:N-succinyl-diaminopimelate deacylase [Rubrivivax sp. A210]|uniref:succinyl-diaminopimelate desuccinylase n=1 Tax=Rubrivivax sp. A210 TaxID=2772301 RepID=UPI0019189DA1|nr:succinyl-diaminopimelate desuccinylase [Rubrivivax sp. A210]CAD5369737.1 N-succinyl-diaminopimelate deacylase [Rubrivivax sp. A210]